jgi:hypothetical protein
LALRDNPSTGRHVGSTTRLILSVFALGGLLLISVYVILLQLDKWVVFRELLRELGIVLFSVFTVSLVYEVWLAEKHLQSFRDLLRLEMEQAETNASSCGQLGILEIFVTREDFDRKYPLKSLMIELDKASEVRIVAVSLFHVINQFQAIKKAVQLGARVNLCMLNPRAFCTVETALPDLAKQDIEGTISTFKKNIVEWVRAEKPPGVIELRYHDRYLFQSYARFMSSERQLGVWDLSFGRHTKDKRIFLLDVTRGLGSDLSKRFDFIWNTATIAFKYEAFEIKVDNVEPG